MLQGCNSYAHKNTFRINCQGNRQTKFQHPLSTNFAFEKLFSSDKVVAGQAVFLIGTEDRLTLEVKLKGKPPEH